MTHRAMIPYFAYGSNLWREQMRRRCPDHELLGPGVLHGYRWIIYRRGYANIVPAAGECVHGLVYRLSARDVETLDRHEKVRDGAYAKRTLSVVMETGPVDCLVYVDPVTEEGAPQPEYVARINHGLRDAALSGDYVARAIRPFIPAD